jgi:thiamine-monophosphate kinase
MNEFFLIKKYFKSLAKKNPSALALSDDIYYNYQKKIAISVDTYVEGVHFVDSFNPDKFLKKILRSSLSDLYCKGIKPQSYFLSLALNKKHANHLWLKKFKSILNSEQNKFKIKLGGGDTTFSSKLVITITVIGFSNYKPVLRKGSSFNDDIYITGHIADSYLGLLVIKKKINFGKYNNFFRKKYYEPNIPVKICSHLRKIASASIDISDGLAQDLKHLCKESNCGALIDLSKLPLSNPCKSILLKSNKNIQDIFSRGDDYQILFTSSQNNRKKIINLSKALNLKISRIGKTTQNMNILFKYKTNKFNLKATKMGYTHIF